MKEKPEAGMNDDHASQHCPWWLGYLLVNPLRRLLQSPVRLIEPYVEEGMTVLEPGCGMGYFTLDLARRVGPAGRVVAVDLQPRMLRGLERRARRAHLLDRLDIRRSDPDRLGISSLDSVVDFGLAFYVVHELTNPEGFFEDVYQALKPGGKLLIVEPRAHGGGDPGLEASTTLATQLGFVVIDRPSIKRNQVVLLGRPGPS